MKPSQSLLAPSSLPHSWQTNRLFSFKVSLITEISISQLQTIATFFLNYFPRPIQVVDARRIRLRRAWRLSLRYRASHLSAVLFKTFLIVSLLISIPRVCVFFQKKSTQMTKKIAFFRHSPPIICIPIFQNFIRYNLYNNGRGWFSSISISFSNHILSTKGTPYPFPTIRG